MDELIKEIIRRLSQLERRLERSAVVEDSGGGGGGGPPSGTVVSETAFGQASAAGGATAYSRGDHTHGTPTDPVTAHEAASDPHPGYLTPTEHTAIGDASPHHAAVTLDSDADVLLGLSTQQITLDSQNANTVLAGPTTGGAVDPTFRALVANDIPAMVGDSGSGGTTGAAPAPGAGDAAAGKFLKADATWAIVPGSGGFITALRKLDDSADAFYVTDSTGSVIGINHIVATGQLGSSIATGSAPLAVASTTVCSNLNADLLDGLDSVAFLPAGVAVYNSGALTIGSGTLTVLTMDSERRDDAAFHSTSSNTARLTVPTGYNGWYSITGNIIFAASSAGARRQVGIRLNGTTLIGLNQCPPTTSGGAALSVAALYYLSATDYVELTAFQDTGGNLDVSSVGNDSPEFRMVRL